MQTPAKNGTSKQGLGARAAQLSVQMRRTRLYPLSLPASTESLVFKIPKPVCCASFACAVHMLVDDNWGICVFAAMDRYQLLSHLSPKFNSLYFENSTSSRK